jgi:uncharacterized RDD family membrane protein YckC
MTDVPPGGLPPPPASYPPPGGYPPPPPPGPGSYSAPPYQQYGYGWSQGGPIAAYAGFWARFAAALLDGLILGVPLSVLQFATLGDEQFRVSGAIGYNPGVSFALNAVSIVVGLLYYGLLEGGPSGQTLGKKALSIRVVDVDTLQPGIGAARGIGRYFARILSELVCFLGYFWMLWDPKKQTWHDKLVRSAVVKT